MANIDRDMSDPPSQEIIFFNKALQLPVAERAAYLDHACADDVQLRHRLDVLLQAHSQAGAFLEEPPTGSTPWPQSLGLPDAGPVTLVPLAEEPEDRIGRNRARAVKG